MLPSNLPIDKGKPRGSPWRMSPSMQTSPIGDPSDASIAS